MADFVYVNIYNEGQIPWLSNTTGPVFGMHVGIGVYEFLARDPRVRIEITTPAEAKEAERKYHAAKAQAKAKAEVKVEDTLTVEDQVQVLEAVQEAEQPLSDDDAEIDAILAEESEATYESVDAEIKDLLRQPKKYTEEELKKMTKKQLSNILIGRGYKAAKKPFEQSSDFSPKYHDTVEQLIEKVLKTQ